MGLFGKKELEICDICGKDVKTNGGINAGKIKTMDGIICRPCYNESRIVRLFGNCQDLTTSQIKDAIENGGLHQFENKAVEMIHVQGLPTIISGPGSAAIEGEELILKAFAAIHLRTSSSEYNTYRIPLDRVLSIDLITQENIKEKNKSVIGRGIVGGMLFGGVGAMLGGMSGIGTKVEVTNTILFVIAYTNAEGEIENIIFNPEKNLFNAEQFVLRFKQDREAEKVYQTNETGDILL